MATTPSWLRSRLVFDCGDEQRTVQQTPATRSAKRTGSNDNSHDAAATATLADDILVEIFSRLPAKSVGRFRCLSRSWAATLTSAPFVALHCHQANDRLMRKLFVTTAHIGNRRSVEVLTKPLHGLVLLHRPPYDGHYVYNPSTGALLPLPDSEERKHVPYGLGYSPATKEYKVVRLVSYNSNPCCEVFTLDVSAHWRAVAQKPLSCAARSAAVFCDDGYLHFLCQQQQGGTRSHSIVTFDVDGETFGPLAVPPAAQGDHGLLELTVLDGCLCLCVFHCLPHRDPYCIWRLACREAGRWEKLYRVLHPQTTKPELDLLRLRWVSPLSIYRPGNGEKKIIFATEEGVLAFDFDLLHGGGEVPRILVSPAEITCNSYTETAIRSDTVGLVEESLVPVGRTSEEIIYSSPWRKAWSDVLKWMPTWSVVDLMCVCKEWRAVINTDRFTKAHALHANLGKSPEIKLVHVHPSFGVFYYPLESCERVQHEVMPFLLRQGSFRIVCSKPCHGLVLVSYTYRTQRPSAKREDVVTEQAGSCCIHYLCNPSWEYSSRIYPDDEDMEKDAGDYSMSACKVGLGYDSRTNRHVLVRLVCYGKGSRDYQLECYIQLTDTISWIPISPPPRPVADMRPAYADGKLYWLIHSELGTESSELLALDVGTREFEVLLGPPCNRDRITSIVEFQGTICILCSDRSRNAIDVWTLEGGSWSRGYRVELGESNHLYPSDETTLLAVDPKDRRILLSTGTALGYYDPKTRALQTIYSLGEHLILQGRRFAPALCQESLIRPWA